MAARRKRGRPRKRTRRFIGPRSPGPLALLARKVHGIDSRVGHLETEVGGIPTKYARRKIKGREAQLGSLEEGKHSKYWASGE